MAFTTLPATVLALLLGTVPFCPADGNGDGVINVSDLVAVILAWGACPPTCPPCPGDTDGNCVVDVQDLLAVLLAWGQCPTPGNDACGGRFEISLAAPGELVVPVDIRGATAGFEPAECVDLTAGAGDVWYTLHNETGGPLMLGLSTSIDVLIEVTAGDTCPPGPLAACGVGAHGELRFPHDPNEVYLIRLVNDTQLSGGDLAGDLIITSTPIAACTASVCADSTAVTTGQYPFDTTGCGSGPPQNAGAPCNVNITIGRETWWQYVATGDGTLTVDTFGSGFDTVIIAATGGPCPPGDGDTIGCSDDTPTTLQSELSLDVTAGQIVRLRIGGWQNASGTAILNVTFTPEPSP